MNDRRVARLAWTLCVLVLMGAVFAAIFDLRVRPVDDNIFKIAESMTTFFMSVAFAVTGALILSRQPRNTVGWLLMLEAGIVFVSPLDTYFNSLGHAPAQPSFLTFLGLWVYGWMWLWFIFPLLFIPLFFPTGKPPSPRWRWLVVLGLGLCGFFIFFVTFAVEFTESNDTWSVPNPIGFLTSDFFPDALWGILLLSFAGLCVASLFVRYRRAQAVEREQIKWLLYTTALVLLLYAISFVANGTSGVLWDLVWTCSSFSILLLPAAIGVAILRHRLYDIDIIIRRTLQYALITGLLALVYFGSVVLLQTIFGSLTGERSPVVIVLSTLLIAALFTPLRRRVQAVIVRRFFRPKYNAQQVLAAYALTARDETDRDSLTAELARVVGQTMQPEQVGVWLKVRSS